MNFTFLSIHLRLKAQIYLFIFAYSTFLIRQPPSPWRWPRTAGNVTVRGVQPGAETSACGIRPLTDPKGLYSQKLN